jgi:hypothetical protein
MRKLLDKRKMRYSYCLETIGFEIWRIADVEIYSDGARDHNHRENHD